MLDAALEGLVAHLTSADGGADLERARAWFHERTGAIEPGEPWYESRIRFFFDDYLCEWRSADGTRPPARLLAAGAGEPAEREVAQACLRAARSLYRVVNEGPVPRLEDLLGGGRFRVASLGSSAKLREGDVFDGRLLVVSDAIQLAPGIIFHPRQTHEPLAEILAALDLDATLDDDRRGLLDGLLRMRMRLDRFTSIRAKHLYRLEALGDRAILSAGWARRAGGST
ncbi:MAG TPA: hypothetical protein RMH99_31780 [Sandaracinaceae bacterium LLY-WYZ-13_1]|nr:hypothetical protein [Sandaracinaceae bacterium LLY-WYZ-13_1]